MEQHIVHDDNEEKKLEDELQKKDVVTQVEGIIPTRRLPSSLLHSNNHRCKLE
jgi:hypothetical protein